MELFQKYKKVLFRAKFDEQKTTISNTIRIGHIIKKTWNNGWNFMQFLMNHDIGDTSSLLSTKSAQVLGDLILGSMLLFASFTMVP